MAYVFAYMAYVHAKSLIYIHYGLARRAKAHKEPKGVGEGHGFVG